MSPRASRCPRLSLPRVPFMIAFVALSMTACAGAPAPEVVSSEPLFKPASPQALALAETALAEGRYEDASTIVERILLGEPQNVSANLVMAEINLAIGDLRRAELGFTQVAGVEEVRPQALQGMAIAQLLSGQSEGTLEALQEAVARDTTLWRAWSALGFLHDQNGAWQQAEDSYAKAIAVRPQSAMLRNNRGYSRILQHRFDEAIEDLLAALALEPGSGEAQRNLRIALAWAGHYTQALAGADPGRRAEVLNNVGYVALLKGDLEEAEGYLLRAMEMDPSFNETAYRNLSLLDSLRTE